MNKKGVWVTPTEFVSFAEPKHKGLTEHIASRARSFDAQALGMYLPNPDPILKAQGKDITVYRDLRSSALVGGNIRRRKSSVLALERDLKRGNAPVRVERFVRDWLTDLDLDRIIREMLDAPLFGFQPIELMWRPIGLNIVPEDLLGKPAEWFLYDQENNLRFRARDAGLTGELCDPQRFVVARQDATYNFTHRNCSSAVARALDAALEGSFADKPFWPTLLRLLFTIGLWHAGQVRVRADALAWTPGFVQDYASALRRITYPRDQRRLRRRRRSARGRKADAAVGNLA